MALQTFESLTAVLSEPRASPGPSDDVCSVLADLLYCSLGFLRAIIAPRKGASSACSLVSRGRFCCRICMYYALFHLPFNLHIAVPAHQNSRSALLYCRDGQPGQTGLFVCLSRWLNEYMQCSLGTHYPKESHPPPPPPLSLPAGVPSAGSCLVSPGDPSLPLLICMQESERALKHKFCCPFL